MKIKQLATGLFFVTAFLLLLISCDSDRKFQVTTYHDQQTIDTLLVDLVSYIGVKPKSADWQTRHELQHRKHYIKHAEEYEFDRYFVSQEGTHYFFLIRPARHARENKRGVGGRFKITEGLTIYDLEELYNTPVMPVDGIREYGREVFMEMIQSGSVDRFIGNKKYLEWPDERLKYDKEKNEWRYDVD